MSKNKPFTVDHVGSFLRPQSIKEARKKVQEGLLSKEELRAIEDQEIKKLVEDQKAVGIKGITDGEFRRGFWHLDFLEELNGIEGYVPETGFNQTFHGKAAPAYNIRVVDKLSFNPNHPFLKDFAFLKEVVETDDTFVAKATIPSLTMILRQEILSNDGSSKIKEIYPDLSDFYEDLSSTYKAAIHAFYEKGIDPKEMAHICTEIINNALEDKPEDLTITTHICRGNHASSWLFSGGYEPIAEELFSTNYDGFFLEYDSDRAGDFTPLRHWSNKESKVVLGLVTSKFPDLEDTEKIKERIKEAQQFVPLENLSISPQCGFASTEEGNHLTEEEQWKKIQLLQQVAKEVWL